MKPNYRNCRLAFKTCLIFSFFFLWKADSHGQELTSEIRALHTETPIVLDGIFSESSWETAIPINQFTQRELHEGEPASEKTEVRVLYDDKNLYFGVRCFDSEPGKIIRNELKRDGAIGNDDHITLVLDTYRDFRTGFYFEVNPNGARRDGLLSGSEENGMQSDWNGVWDVAAHIDDTGWSVEIVIPIKTLRFPVVEQSVWGFNVLRHIKRKGEEVLWTSWKRNDGLMQLSKAGILKGMEGLRIRKMVELKPFSLIGRERILSEKSSSFKNGLDIKYPITSTLVLDLTAYTDFAQVEADRTEINLTRFSIRYPEKRDFFLEGAETFSFGLRGADVFYSRRIGITPDRKQVPVLGGARLTGKTGKYRIGLLNIQTDRQNGFPATNYLVARMTRDVLEKSTVGMMATHLYSRGGYDNQTIGADFSYKTSSFLGSNNLIISGALAATFTDGRGSNNTAASLSMEYPNDNFENSFEFSVIPDGFDPGIGYVKRRGIKSYQGGFRWTPRPRLPFIKKMVFKPVEMTYLTDMSGRLLSRGYEARPLGIEFNSGDQIEVNMINNYDYLDQDFEIFRDAIVPRGTYSWWSGEVQLESSGKRKITSDFSVKWGDFYTGQRLEMDPDVGFKINENIAFSTQFTYNRISLGTQSFATKEYSGRLTLNLSTRLTSRTFLQWNNEDKQFYVNFLINFIPKIGSDFYFVYNQVWDGEHHYRIYSKTGIAKIAYMWRL